MEQSVAPHWLFQQWKDQTCADMTFHKSIIQYFVFTKYSFEKKFVLQAPPLHAFGFCVASLHKNYNVNKRTCNVKLKYAT
jgi:hypothetical protein